MAEDEQENVPTKPVGWVIYFRTFIETTLATAKETTKITTGVCFPFIKQSTQVFFFRIRNSKIDEKKFNEDKEILPESDTNTIAKPDSKMKEGGEEGNENQDDSSPMITESVLT